MVRKVIIEILLVPESLDKKPDEIEKEILKEFNDDLLTVPWSYEIKKVTVVDL